MDRGPEADDLITDIAAIFHWPLSELDALPFNELVEWHQRAVAWFNRVHGPKEGS